jgi:hypothetical protein
VHDFVSIGFADAESTGVPALLRVLQQLSYERDSMLQQIRHDFETTLQTATEDTSLQQNLKKLIATVSIIMSAATSRCLGFHRYGLSNSLLIHPFLPNHTQLYFFASLWLLNFVNVLVPL